MVASGRHDSKEVDAAQPASGWSRVRCMGAKIEGAGTTTKR